MYIIVNSCGTRCFDQKTFKSCEDGWDFLYNQFPNDDQDEILDDFFVIKKNEPHQEFIGGFYMSVN
jgi:hypothetical protein